MNMCHPIEMKWNFFPCLLICDKYANKQEEENPTPIVIP